jgi:hypothetical protein
MSFDPFRASVQPYPITNYQPTYFLAESFTDAKEKLWYDYFKRITFQFILFNILVNIQRLFHDHFLFIIIHIHKPLKSLIRKNKLSMLLEL